MADDMAAYRDVFLSESAEYLDAMVAGLLELESDPGATGPVETIFRGAHSLKGMAGAMAYEATADLTHKMESLMECVRRRERAVDSTLIDLLLRAIDEVKALIAEESEGAVAHDVSGMVAELVEAASPGAAGDAGGDAREGAVGPAAVGVTAGAARRVRVAVTLDQACALRSVRAYMVLKRLSHMGTVVDTVPSAQDLEDEQFGDSFEVVLESAEPDSAVRDVVAQVSEVVAVAVEPIAEDEPAAAETVPDAAGAAAEPERRVRRAVTKLGESQTVRVSIGHLDTLVDLVGELVILRARMERHAGLSGDRELAETVEDLHRLTSELQHEVMQTRMVPVGNIFNRFPRMVRDLARDLGKDVAFEMAGTDIELDRTVLDEIGDPIVHLLRNCLDHGVERPDDRRTAGKPARATVELEATRERDQVRIRVSDDGRGMDVERIWSRAADVGLVRPEEREQYSDRQVLLLTCVPGFSTAERATKVSGRGVGMDVVKGKIEYLGGALEIASTAGRGTSFTLSLPLTLAIVQALLVGVGDQVYAVPLSAVGEVYSPDDVRIETVDARPVLVLRDGEVVPLHHLGVLLGDGSDPLRLPGSGEHIVLLTHGGQSFGLVTESLVGRQEIVIKPLSRIFRNVRGLGGATLLGDGRVVLILDPRTLDPSREGAS